MFTDNMVNAIKLMDDPKKFMSSYLNKLKNSNLATGDILKQAQARENLKPYADFVCDCCGKMFLKEQAIVQQGMCDSPNCSGMIQPIVHANNDIAEEKDKSEEYTCRGCGEQCKCKEIINNKKVCKHCGSKNFVKTALLDKVVQNTLQMNQSLNAPIIDAEHIKGDVYAYYSYEAEDSDVPVQVGVKAAGKFTENDFIHFDLSGSKPRAIVATLTNDPLIKFCANNNVECKWDINDPENYEYIDNNNRIILKGSKLEWSIPEGVCYANVKGFSSEGVKIQFSKHPKFGKLKSDDPYGECVLSQDYIKTAGVSMIATE